MCSTFVVNCKTETQIKMRGGTVEHIPARNPVWQMTSPLSAGIVPPSCGIGNELLYNFLPGIQYVRLDSPADLRRPLMLLLLICITTQASASQLRLLLASPPKEMHASSTASAVGWPV